MIVIPAIDLRQGRCVRLAQGDFSRVTVYGEDPAAMARHWRDKGAERLHVVDLDGSLAGAPRNAEAVSAIVGAVDIPVEVGGGIRDLETVRFYLGLGVRWVILGTAALRDEAFVREACDLYPDQVILGIDAKGGQVAVSAWTEEGGATVFDLAERYGDCPIAAIVYTDIRRDGMETGVNIEATGELARRTHIPVIASGGVAGLGDIERLLPLETEGVIGVIVGRALYTGALDLTEAVRVTKRAENFHKGR
ncbi:MAG TPA: 1-(5-phosphoribosyl)-5-[(5-phosphoribosylamino)methylideneamino]imidazole-4-carboxamide isomerase [Syntrophales bacterium]|nr:1-(5-phosphoribosyl)-5-[(5-phosphoribosylamino)methylideneamino]imidazole-4-carboxamide isomerase [Syntrophales bacterium]HON99598.1 1-(5-phosphoribosyl)-5-[(5-phosphoribosylamino)methylideneamino]imidazole-4-carboxamide isomerase [Syntrophales bacterium]HPC01091.1 1-(5-phosphoribosyl)-5-[(5-phosphoribosylamino)methylideneamino]imidazole-4-carboxamide isomerase [Syntrophales bacterium]HPQ06771.1 1-(5-phosphoribosyl)-5-[(5-phosphoribosylamino)methylideneamino]imidazole-4-carboxamide isomerase 